MTGDKRCVACQLVSALAVVGALNWGLVGLMQFDVVAVLLGPQTPAARSIYMLIGIAGILKVLSFFKCCPCQKGTCAPKS